LLSCAIDNEGEVLDFLVQLKKHAKAALKLIKKLLKKQGFAPTLITDKLKSYHKAFRILGLNTEHIDNKRANNRAENSHLPIRKQERKMQKFKSPGSAQKFLNIHSATYNIFYTQRHLITRTYFKECRSEAFGIWKSATTAACVLLLRFLRAYRKLM
jgi:transposase-like protein|tara:strand:+ start:214 stop:684 length:471 start_codon:yes stop_codon:yes gene_type:complete